MRLDIALFLVALFSFYIFVVFYNLCSYIF